MWFVNELNLALHTFEKPGGESRHFLQPGIYLFQKFALAYVELAQFF